ncbi:MAG: ABC transporter permease [bacterium]
MRALIKELISHRELLHILIVRNIKIRYKESVLGFLWTLLNPILLIGIYALFLGIMRLIDRQSFEVLVTGVFVWQYVALCLGDSAGSIVGNANLIKKSAFPRIILPLSMVLANLVNFLLSLLVVLVFLFFVGHLPGLWLWLPVMLLAHIAVCAGVSFFLAAANVYFRDVQQVTGLLTMAWFFLSPVLYRPEFVMESHIAPWLKAAFFLNPMTGILCGYRAILLGYPLPQMSDMAISLGMAGLILILGTLVFQRLEKRFADEL